MECQRVNTPFVRLSQQTERITVTGLGELD
jgi:hypothetical protein